MDISDTIDLKFEALGKHASQLSVQQMKETMSQQAAKAGAKYGYRYAEPFTRIDIG